MVGSKELGRSLEKSGRAGKRPTADRHVPLHVSGKSTVGPACFAVGISRRFLRFPISAGEKIDESNLLPRHAEVRVRFDVPFILRDRFVILATNGVDVSSGINRVGSLAGSRAAYLSTAASARDRSP
jgi:hypothetical protein